MAENESKRDSRQKILKVATQLFAEKGFEGVSIREISKKAEVNLALVSYHFGGKNELYKAIFEEHANSVVKLLSGSFQDFESEKPTRKNFEKGIYQMISNLVEMRLQSPEISMLFMRERLQGMPNSKMIFENIFGPLTRKIVNRVKIAQKMKLVRQDLNPDAYLISMIEAIMGYFMMQECGMSLLKRAYKIPQQKKQYIEFLVKLYTEGVYR